MNFNDFISYFPIQNEKKDILEIKNIIKLI